MGLGFAGERGAVFKAIKTKKTYTTPTRIEVRLPKFGKELVSF